MAKDPYKYFRVEAREILEGLAQGIMLLEAGEAPPDEVGRLLRLAHTLKGAARVVKLPAIAELAHSLEDGLTPHRDAGVRPGREAAGALLRLVDAATSRLSDLGAPVAPAPANGPTTAHAPAPAEPVPATPAAPAGATTAIADTVRIDIRDMDVVLEGLTEAGAQVGGLRHAVALLGQAQLFASALAQQLRDGGGPDASLRPLETARDLADDLEEALDRGQAQLLGGIEHAQRELLQLQDHAGRLRLVAASTLFAPLARAVRDAAQALGRQVELETSGGEARLDAPVLSALRDALLHIVRNAVAHGIEDATERAAAGKPPLGRIELRVEQRGRRVRFLCRDDGRGIDVDAVRRTAVARGLVGAAEAAALSPEDAAGLVFLPGVSTSARVTEVSGRGVGLDVVREAMARLKGEVRAHSELGRGTTLELTVPITLSSLAALSAEAAGRPVWIPLDAVARTLRAPAADVARSSDGDTLLLDEGALPFLALPRLLGQDQAAAPAAWSVVVVRDAGGPVAVGVDRLRGLDQVVVRPLPRVIGAFPLLAGAVIDADGVPSLVLDPAGLAAAARRAGSVAPAPPRPRPPILVVDDSLTTRMLEQSILENAGYEVELAVCAEEGLEKARQRRYGLFLVDVEMPGMNGFEFVARTKNEPGLRDVPAILVTSLGSPEHRRLGIEAGAQAHIVKGEFDEGRLRQLIRELMG